MAVGTPVEAAMPLLLAQLGDKSHLQREKALEQLQSLLTKDGVLADALWIQQLQNGIQDMLRSEEWEQRLGALRSASCILVHGPSGDEAFSLVMIQACKDLLEDREVRVRWAVGEVLHKLSDQMGVAVWEYTQDRILSSITTNFDRDNAEPSSQAPPGSSSPSNTDEPGENDVLSGLLQQTYRVEPPGTGEMRHGTEGWKCLETSMRALQHIMEGCGPAFKPYLDETVRGLVYKGLLHPNRFVREACHFIIGSFCKLLEGPELQSLGPEIANKLGMGLSDNWSQVRYAASTATRTFMLCCAPFRDEVLPLLVPHMCLNRYYVAEGVRLYSQETWKIVMGDEGREWVARCAPQVVSYYIEQSKANNHAVREAACACIAELMSKVDRDAVSPHVPRLLRALVNCFKDASWPVRDAACLACGRCVMAFPEESREVLEELYGLWFAHLQDNIYSVRHDSAVALGDAARAYGEEALLRIVEQLRQLLPMAKEQPADSKARSGLENTTLFGVAAQRQERANDPALHTDQTMFSCGSLAPKLQRGGGCVDHGFSRAREPWEATDGAIYLLRELSEIAPEQVPQFMPELAEASRLTHFSHCLVLQETLWKALPDIAHGMGKKAFKPFLEEFLDPMFRGLECGHRLCEAAAAKCIGKLRDFIGPNIFAGRLSDQQRRVLETHPDIPPPGGIWAGASGSIPGSNGMMPPQQALKSMA